jgi:type I restriction enzyme M protein
MLGRFGPGLPKVTDGALLFVLHLIKKMRPKDAGGGRAGIVLSASAFYNGDAGSGYSEIRKFLLMNDLVDAIVGLPDSMFYNTGIPTYLWILDNDKPAKRKGKVQLVDASESFERRRKSLGEKRKEITQKNIEKIAKLYSGFDNSEESKVFKNSEFEYEIKKFEIPLRMRVKNSTRLKKDYEVILETLSLSDQFSSQLTQDVMSLALEARSTQAFIEDVRNLLKSQKIKASFNQVVVLLKPFFELDPDADPIVDSKGKVIIDTSQTFTEKAPSSTDWDTYLSSNVLPVRPGAVLSAEPPESGFEILWARIFARPRNSFDFKELGSRIATLRAQLLEAAERSANV